MNKSRLSNRELSHFRLIDLQRFLEMEDWKLIEQSSKALIYSGPKLDSGNPLEFILPNSEKNLDYFDRINDIVFLISALKDIDVKKVLDLISQTNFDILQMRILNPGDFKFSIPLDVAASEIDALKRLFTFGACSEERARPFYDKPTTIGINHANQCQFGHTFEGSFGFTINSPITSDFSQLSLFSETKQIPFERKVMERIVTGFINTQSAIDNDDLSILINNFETGFNSRMCDALVDISLEKSKVVEFSVNWCHQITPKSDVLEFKKILLSENSYDVLKEASIELQKVEPFTDTIIGKIITLHSNKSPFSDEEFPRTAIIKHSYENRIIEVKLELNKEEYKVVYQAHGDGKTVKVVGKLFRKGSTWRMFDISSLNFFNQ